jgi:hypothetical protein
MFQDACNFFKRRFNTYRGSITIPAAHPTFARVARNEEAWYGTCCMQSQRSTGTQEKPRFFK